MSLTLAEIARLVGAEIQPEHAAEEIFAVNSLEDAVPGEITFLSNPRYSHFLETTKATAVIVGDDARVPVTTVALVVDDPYFAFLRLLELFNKRQSSDIANGIDDSAKINQDAVIGKNVSIGAFAYIGPGVRIGDGTTIGPCSVILRDASVGCNCLMYPNVTIMDGCVIGDDVILHAGVVIGSDGFGFAPYDGALRKIPQIGIVKIEDGVEIQACSCIDRAAFGVTLVSKGSKIDNLVQVGHNVRIGPSTVIAAQSGISGSTTIGAGVRLGGQSGLSGHLHIGDGASVGAQAGVTKDVIPGDIVSGYPARTHSHELRLEASIGRIPELLKTVRRQEKKIMELEQVLDTLINQKK
jgi:UDP-3-O-[3-hydroxymyristoyl] glucosamine N-acyltransferase